MRPIWSGSISFGLVNIPIRLYPGTKEHTINLDMLHKKDLSPIRYAKICKLEEKEVPYEEIVKGYEFQKGEYVLFSDEDFQKVYPKKSKTIEIKCFSNSSEIDTIYYDKPYILEPDKGASKAYTLLREALKHSKKVAVCLFVLRNREHLAVLKPYDRGIVLQELRFHDEIRNMGELELPVAGKAVTKELDMAIKLIDQLSEPFKADSFKDTYTEEFQEVINDKLRGKKLEPKASQEPKTTGMQDLMAKLKGSLEKYKPSKKTMKKSGSIRRRSVKTKEKSHES